MYAESLISLYLYTKDDYKISSCRHPCIICDYKNLRQESMFLNRTPLYYQPEKRSYSMSKALECLIIIDLIL